LGPSNELKIPSFIKFGDWDQNAITPGHTLKMFKTNSRSKWSIPAQDIWFNDEKILDGVEKLLELNPHLPFIYIPEADWTHFGYAINKLYYQTNRVDCNPRLTYCRF
jgi:hypothetical protein